MKLAVRYFASLRERLGKEQESIVLDAGSATVADLVGVLAAKRGVRWADPLRAAGVRAAVNQELAMFTTPVHDGDEVAFLPPVTGG